MPSQTKHFRICSAIACASQVQRSDAMKLSAVRAPSLWMASLWSRASIPPSARMERRSLRLKDLLPSPQPLSLRERGWGEGETPPIAGSLYRARRGAVRILHPWADYDRLRVTRAESESHKRWDSFCIERYALPLRGLSRD